MAYELIKVSELPELITPSDPNVMPIQDGDYLKRISFENLKDTLTGDCVTEDALEETLEDYVTQAEAATVLDDYALKDGTYEDLTAGTAQNLVSATFIENTEPYLKRPTGNSTHVGNKEYLDEVVGGSLVWNQGNNNTASTSTAAGVTYTNNGNGSWTIKGSGTGVNRKQISTPSSIAKDDILYFKTGSSVAGSDSTFYVCFSISGSNVNGVGNLEGKVTKAAYAYNQFSIRTFSGFSSNDGITLWPQYMNLTKMFGPTVANFIYSLEQSSEGAGVAWLKQYLDLDTYHAYETDTLKHVQTSAHVTKDANNTTIGNYPLDGSVVLRGIPTVVNGKLKWNGDTYEPDGAVTRNTILRAFQAGDRELANALTDGTNTVVYSANESSETADPYTQKQVCDPYGTEEFVTTDLVPVGTSTRYTENLTGKLEGLPWDLSMIAPIENGATASKAYTTGQYFLHNNVFCKAKTAIASGATFTLGTNYEETTVAAELYAALH